MPDFECTWFPDVWFGISLTDCCVSHDLGGTNQELYQCALDALPWYGDWVAVAMLVGLSTLGVGYQYLQKRKKRHEP